MRRGRKAEAAQRRVQGAGGDGGAFGGEDPVGAVGGGWGSSNAARRSTSQTKCGQQTSPTSPCNRGFCTWSRSSTGRPDGCCPGGCRTRSRRGSWPGRCAEPSPCL